MLIPDSFEEQDIPRTGPGAGLSEIATPQAFGEGVAQTAGYGAQILTRAHYDAALQANKVAALDKHNTVEAWTQKAWLDPQTGLRNQNLGAQAPAASQKLLSDFDNVVSTQRSALANDQQRDIFDAQTDQIRQHLMGQTDEYAGQQLHQHAEGVYSASVGLAHNAIANNPSDAEAQIAKIQGLVTNHAALNGFAPGSDESKFMVQGAVSDAHTTALTAMMGQQNFTGAQAYYTAHETEIQGKDRVALQTAIKNGSVEQQAQDISRGFLDGAKGVGETLGGSLADDGSGLYDRQKFDDQVDKDPRLSGSPEAEKLRERVVEHGEARIGQNQKAIAERNNQITDKVYGSIYDPTGDGTIPADMASLMTSLPRTNQEALRQESARAVKAQYENTVPDTDSSVWSQNHDLLLTDPQKLTSKSTSELFATYGQAYSPADFKAFVGKVDEARKGLATGDILTPDQQRDHQIRSSVAPTIGTDRNGVSFLGAKDLSGFSPEQLGLYHTITTRVQAAADNWESQNKKAPDQTQLQGMIDSEISAQTKPVDVDTPGRLWGTNTSSLPLWQVPAAQRTNISIPLAQVPTEAQGKLRTQVAQYANIDPIKVDDRTIQHAYAALVRGDRDAYNAIVSGKPAPSPASNAVRPASTATAQPDDSAQQWWKALGGPIPSTWRQ